MEWGSLAYKICLVHAALWRHGFNLRTDIGVRCLFTGVGHPADRYCRRSRRPVEQAAEGIHSLTGGRSRLNPDDYVGVRGRRPGII